MKTLILIVAYEAENHIQSVLSRIPWSRLKGQGQVLVLDDASSDKTSDLAATWTPPKNAWPIQVLKNPVNLGYGGNQKIGYGYAIRHNFDHVVLLHGDGQYAPEFLPEMMDPLIKNRGMQFLIANDESALCVKWWDAVLQMGRQPDRDKP